MSVAIYLHDLSGGGVERQSLIIAEEFWRDGADVVLVLHRLRGQLLDQVPAGLRIVNLNSPRTLLDIPRLGVSSGPKNLTFAVEPRCETSCRVAGKGPELQPHQGRDLSAQSDFLQFRF